MLAAVTQAPGVLTLDELPDPGPPGPQEVLIRPEVVGICGSDLHVYRGEVGALSGARSFFPRVQGHEFSAIIEAAGQDCPAITRVLVHGLSQNARWQVPTPHANHVHARPCGQQVGDRTCREGDARAVVHGDGGLQGLGRGSRQADLLSHVLGHACGGQGEGVLASREARASTFVTRRAMST